MKDSRIEVINMKSRICVDGLSLALGPVQHGNLRAPAAQGSSHSSDVEGSLMFSQDFLWLKWIGMINKGAVNQSLAEKQEMFISIVLKVHYEIRPGCQKYILEYADLAHLEALCLYLSSMPPICPYFIPVTKVRRDLAGTPTLLSRIFEKAPNLLSGL
ncbi:hypothetical protein E5288_WYG017781 [Bos mutus]|uniref:Uncharacterized protein n=1 Tax=Bos mutus TaxID=72004 RepID=A0A6B0RDZ9_9CETA|nr:hypothetical protein [Bos mutus]